MFEFATRQDIARSAARLLAEGFVLLDLETTGLDRDPGVEIVEIAILNHRGEVLLNTLVRPQGRIPSQASRVHGITDAAVVDVPPFEEVYEAIAGRLAGQTAVAYNYTFERNILHAVCRRHQKPPVAPQKWWCAMRAYQAFIRSRGWYTLRKACARERIRIDDTHRALGDCQMTLALLYVMAAAGGSG